MSIKTSKITSGSSGHDLEIDTAGGGARVTTLEIMKHANTLSLSAPSLSLPEQCCVTSTVKAYIERYVYKNSKDYKRQRDILRSSSAALGGGDTAGGDTRDTTMESDAKSSFAHFSL